MKKLPLLRLLALMFAALCLSLSAKAGNGHATGHAPQITYTLRGGIVIGGTAPLPLPRCIRDITAFSPWGMTMIGLDAQRDIKGRWGIRSGLRLSLDGMNTEARVKNYHLTLTQGGDKLTGYYTGLNKTHERMLSLKIPLLATYRAGEKITLYAGPYVQYAFDKKFTGRVYDGYLREGTPTGMKVSFTRSNPATYDFSDDMTRFLLGAEAGADWQVASRWAAFANLDFGATGIFKRKFKTIEFKMYPVYLTLGMAYTL